VTAAWPTINDIPHLGTMLHLLSADVISRYLKLLGERVISVTGSDAHGTPIVIAAEHEGLSPEEFSNNMHQAIVDILHEWNIEFDNYTITTTAQHKAFTQQFYDDLNANGFVEIKESLQFYCKLCDLFLADRFVEGQCPYCEDLDARGDQCANKKCNEILTPTELINPRCFKCAMKPQPRKTSHWYFKLHDFEKFLLEYITTTLKISKAAQNEEIAFIKNGLDDRALTRDLKWGISAEPSFLSAKDKVFYVWAEDVLGYVSASIPIIEEKWQRSWQDIWTDPATRSVYCLGKDNVFYHAIWFPALLSAASLDYTLPYALSTTQHIQFDGQAFSKSKGIGLLVDKAVEIAPADYWRYYLIKHRPENKDSNFTWDDFVTTINKDLADIIGNFTLRLVTLLWKYNNGKIPKDTKLEDAENSRMIAYIDEKLEEIKVKIFDFQIKNTLNQTITIARKINEHFTHSEPWAIKIDSHRDEVLRICYVGWAKVALLLLPIIPSISLKLMEQLGLSEFVEQCGHLDGIDTWISEANISIPEKSFFIEKIDLS
jgi:methionyl-tRNA synthetase